MSAMKNIYVVTLYWDSNGVSTSINRYFTNKKKAVTYKKWRESIKSDDDNKDNFVVHLSQDKVNEYDYLMEG